MVETRHRPEVREGEDHADARTTPGPTGRATAPSWQGPFAKRRAVIPAAGYYEWQPTEDADGNPWVTINKQLRPAPSGGARSLSLTRHRVELPDIDRHCVHAVQLLEGARTRC
jgi:hypothetical protein